MANRRVQMIALVAVLAAFCLGGWGLYYAGRGKGLREGWRSVLSPTAQRPTPTAPVGAGEPAMSGDGGENSGGLAVDLDIADVLKAVFWPALLLGIGLAYRRELPVILSALAARVTKLEFAGISIDLAVAKPFSPDWSTAPVDLRHEARPMAMGDSGAWTFFDRLAEEGTADYAEIDLGAGGEWLTSRVFVLATVFARIKGIECVVFLETTGSTRRRYVGLAGVRHIQRAFARRYPWLADACRNAVDLVAAHYGANSLDCCRIDGPAEAPDPHPSIALVREFIDSVQASTSPPPGPERGEWVALGPETYEHAAWLDGGTLEGILGRDFSTSAAVADQLRLLRPAEQVRTFLSMPGRFVAVVAADGRFERLVDRHILLEQIARAL